MGRGFGASFIAAASAVFLIAPVTCLSVAFAQPMPPEQHSAGTAETVGEAGSTSPTMPGYASDPPDASRIYHAGATGFFLDYSAAIHLTADQQVALSEIRETAIGELAAAQRQIDQAEQELLLLTSSDRPNSMTLEMKVREIEGLKGDQRIAFIESVGKAVRVLTDEQRAALRDTGAPSAARMTAPQDPADFVTPQVGMADDSMGEAGGGNTPNTADPNPADEHASHHPGATAAGVPGASSMGASTPMAAPAAPPGPAGAPGMAGGGMGEMMRRMMGPASPGGCMGDACGSRAARTPIYPSLMTLPALTPEKRVEIDALASQQMNEGMERLTTGSESLSRATKAGDHAAMQQSVGLMREGLDELGAGIAARRVLSEGKAPRNLALEWFKREMNLASPIAPEEPRALIGVPTFHFFTMALLVAFALAMVALYFFKMRRAAALFGRIEPDSGAPPPGASSPLAGSPPPSSPLPPPAGKAPAPGGTAALAAPTSPATRAVVSQASPASPLTANWRGQLRVGSIVAETPSVKTFRLLPSSSDSLMPFTFLPGQFLNVAFGIGGARMHRSYSISSSPTQRDYVDLTVRREPRGAVSRHINDLLKVGDQIDAGGPVGRFTFTGTEADGIVLISGGVGITPMMSIIRYLTERSWPGDIFFVYACRSPTDFIFSNELAALQNANPKLHVAVTMSRPEGTDWKGPSGRVTKDLLTRTIPDLASRRIHLCGPPSMMDSIKAVLAELGVAPDQVKTEAFGAIKPIPAVAGTTAKPTAPATGPLVTFSKNNKEAKIRVGQTVLELSEELAIGIEFSCRVGTCGVCKVKMTSGEVEMAVDDALDPDDKANGIILACQAMPKGDITVEA